jgi:predicted transposase YbfD/YdcC
MEKPRKLSLITILKEVPDPRVERRKLHGLADVLCIAICALLCGADSFEDMEVFGEAKSDWFETFLELPNGIPSHDTFNRVFAAIDPEKFLECFIRWTQSLRSAIAEEIVALDGKALRRAINAGDCPKVVVSAWAADNGLALGQLKTNDKSNEITAVPKLLRALELGGCIVTLDAMGCQ